MKAFANNLKSIYHAPNEEAGFKAMESVIMVLKITFQHLRRK